MSDRKSRFTSGFSSRSGGIKRRRTNVTFRKKKSAMSTAKTALRIVKKLERNQEKKVTTLGITVDAISSICEVFPFCQIAQGDRRFNRDGAKVTITGIGLSLAISKVPGSSNVPIVRVMIIQDLRQIAATTPACSDVLSSEHPLGYLSEEFGNRFIVHFDKMFMLDSIARGSHLIRFWKKVNINQRYFGPVISDISKNGLYLLWISDSTSDFPVAVRTERLTFTDS